MPSRFWVDWAASASELSERLTRPSPHITDARVRRRARLLASLQLFAAFTITLAGLASLALGYSALFIMGLALAVLLIPLYAMTRSRLFPLSIWLTLIAAMTVTVITAIISSPTALGGLPLLVMLAAQFLNRRGIVIVGLMNVLALVIALAVAPGMSAAALINMLTLIAIGLVLSVIVTRDLDQSRVALEQQARELSASEARYRLVIAALAEGVVVYHTDPHQTISNQSAERILGLDRWQIAGLAPYPPDWHPLWEDGTAIPYRDLPPKVALRTGAAMSNLIVGIQKPSGTITWTAVNARPLVEEGAAEPYAVVASFADITALKQAQQWQSESERRYQALFEQSNDAIFILDMKGQHIAANARAAELMGYTVDELLCLGFRDLVAPGHLSQAEEAYRRLRDGQTLALYERDFRRKDGTIIPVEINVSLIRDPEGQPVLIQSIVRDITERKLGEQSLRESEEKLRLIVDESPDVILIVDGRTRLIVQANRAAARILGYDPARLVGQRFGLLFPRDVKETQEVQFSGPVLQKQPILRADGELCLMDITSTLMPWGDSKALLVTLRDVTERERFEQQRLELSAERTRVNALRRFIGDISHDLRTPLSVMNTSVYLLRKKLPSGDPTLTRHLDALEAQTQHMTQILQDFLDMARLDFADVGFQFHLLDLNALVSSLVAQHQALADRKGLSLRFEPQADGAVVNADSTQLSRAVQNVLVNAISYTPAGGVVTVQTGLTDSAVSLKVTDTGIGIDPSALPHIFERFYRADNARPINSGGSGLGLAITRKIIERHGGDISAESVVGRGSTFVIRLPLARDPDAQSR